jgi:hypothetical protein
VAVSRALFAENLFPGGLGIVQHKGDELDERLLFLVAGGIGLADRSACANRTSATSQGEEVALKDNAKNKEDNDSAKAEMDAAGTEASAAFTSPIFYIVAAATGRPTHGSFL